MRTRAELRRQAILPGELDTLLLQAAVHPDDRGVAAWKALRPHFDLDDATPGQVRLLPLVLHTLTTMGEDDPDLARMAGVRRAHWVGAERVRRAAEHVVGALASEGIDTMLLKGAAVAPFYSSPALRPMADTDILVRPSSVPRVYDLLREIGFTGPDLRRAPMIACRHGAEFKRDDGVAVDVHWFASRHLGAHGVANAQRRQPWWDRLGDDEWWDRAVPFALGEASTLVPSSADLLLHVVLHGARFGSPDDLRWVADAATVVSARADQLDWDLLVEQAARRRVVVATTEALTYLRHAIGVAIPDATLAAASSLVPDRRERVVGLLIRSIPHVPLRQGRTLATLAARYAALTSTEPLGATVRGFPWFVALWLGHDRPRDLVLRRRPDRT